MKLGNVMAMTAVSMAAGAAGHPTQVRGRTEPSSGAMQASTISGNGPPSVASRQLRKPPGNSNAGDGFDLPHINFGRDYLGWTGPNNGSSDGSSSKGKEAGLAIGFGVPAAVLVAMGVWFCLTRNNLENEGAA